MNNKGFAITGFIYTIFVLFIIVMVAILNMFNARKNILDKLKYNVQQEVNTKSSTSSLQSFEVNDSVTQFTAYKSSFYKITLKARKLSGKGGVVSFEMFLNKGEVLYMKTIFKATIGNDPTIYDIDVAVSFDKNFDENNIIAVASHVPDTSVKNMVAPVMNNRKILNPTVKILTNESDKNTVHINTIEKAKVNDDLNRVRYIKDCMHGGSGKKPNSWAEIRAFVNGENVALGKSATILGGAKNSIDYLTDNNESTYTNASSTSSEVCAILDLGRTYNLDSIQVIHEIDAMAYSNKTSVSLDNKEFKVISVYDETETKNGVIIDAYDDKQVKHVGNVYVPVKRFDDALWLRVFHHNNLNGTVYWSAKSQVLTDGGYEALHKQSVLYNLDEYKNKSGQFEFYLNYSDIKDGHNRWIQTSNPTTKTEEVTGYKEVNALMKKTNWHGLALSSTGATLLDGDKGSTWFYAVGVISAYQGGVPVYTGFVSKQSTDLWVRIDNLK